MAVMRVFITVLFTFLWTTTGFWAYAQNEGPENLPKFDNKLMHFGFQLGLSSNGFGLSADLTRTDSLTKLETGYQPGFVIHVVNELHMGPHLGLRFTPGISFAARDLQYTFYTPKGISEKPEVHTIESTFLEAPLHLKYRSKRVGNFAQYITAGFNYSFDLASDQYSDNTLNPDGSVLIKLKQHNYNLEAGVGFDFFLEYFKFTPELKFSYGINNVAVPDATPYSAPLTDVRSRIFVIALNFEG